LVIDIKHPVIWFVLSSVVAILLFFASSASIEPRYFVDKTATIASSLDGNENLEVLWNGEEIENVKSTQVALWNAGRKYLDKISISEDSPIKIHLSNGGRILSHKILKVSRGSLEFDVDVKDDNLVINFKNDEALEKNDGLLIEVLYTGNSESSLVVQGRIKGVPDGFEEDAIYSLRLAEQNNFLKGALIVMLAFMLFAGAINTSHGVKQYKRGSKNCWFCLISGSLMLLLSIISSIYVIQLLFFGLVWLSA